VISLKNREVFTGTNLTEYSVYSDQFKRVISSKKNLFYYKIKCSA
jgi:hypothetical protein